MGNMEAWTDKDLVRKKHSGLTSRLVQKFWACQFPAIYGRQPLYFQDPIFQVRAEIESPKHTDKLLTVPVHEEERITL
jgi:hypothetical protein